MGDSGASRVVVTAQQDGSTTRTKHTVTSIEASHMETSHQSAVHIESVVQGSKMEGVSQSQSIQNVSQSQSIHGVSQSQSIQSVSQSQSIQSVSQSQSIQSVSQSKTTEGFSQSQSIEGASQLQSLESTSLLQSVTEVPAEAPAVIQSASEPQSVDENANSIQEEQQANVQPPPPETLAEPESVKEPEAVKEPEPVAEPVPVTEPEPVKEIELVVESESVKESEPVTEPEPIKEPEPVVESLPEPEPVKEPEPVEQPEPAVEPESAQKEEPVAEALPDSTPVPTDDPEPFTEPPAEPEPTPVIESQVSEVEEISQESIKTQLHEIITEIEREVLPEQEEVQGKETGQVGLVQVKSATEAKSVAELEVVKEAQHVVVDQDHQPLETEEVEEGEEVEYYDEDGVLHHTWRPRGIYEVQKTPVKYEDVVPITVPDVRFTESEPEPPQPQPQPHHQQVDLRGSLRGMTNGSLSPSFHSPIEIPEGIPLLARILPKVDHGEEGDTKISLERLFTPATDSGDLTPIRSTSKKAYASSSFYRPDHPTIDDQVELAQRISFSLVDENNKMSRGQSMYMKRKKRSMRWIHEGGEGEDDFSGPGSGSEAVEDEPTQRTPTKPPMKLLMSPKGVQDFHAVQEHYQALMNAAPPSPEVGKIVTEVQSPTGKGAELFAKRKKRMDQFIVDDTTVQKAHQQQITTSQQSFSSASNFSSTSTSSFTSKKQAEYERNQQQEQILMSAPSVGGAAHGAGTGAIYTAEVKVVQRASLPPTPVIDVPHHSLLDLSCEDKSDKRRSISFNLAAKGWGTYNKFYTPVTFAT